ncbi:MAG: hypothetical protein ACT4PE_07720 [Candidatus Eiseniibacteriota bacterium]
MKLSAFTVSTAVLAAQPAQSVVAWGPEANLSLTATDSETGLNHRPMAITSDGTFHIVWAEKDAPNQNYRVWTRRLESGTWSASEVIVDYLASDPGTSGGAKYPSLAAAGDGSLHLFWHDYRVAGINNIEIFTKAREAGGAWDPERVADVRLTATSHPETLGDNGYVPTPGATAAGAMHVLWYDFRYDGQSAEILSKTRPPGGSWDLTPGDAADARVTLDADHSELVAADADAAGRVHAVWRSASAGTRILYAERDPLTGIWSSPIQVDVAGAVAGAPALSLDGAGRVHVVWPDSRNGGRALWTRVREAGGAWGAESRLTRPADAADEPSLDAAPDGTLHLVWQDGRVSLLSPKVFHREKAPAAAWDTTYASDTRVSLSTATAVRSSVLSDDDGGIFVCWKDLRTGSYDIFLRRGGPAGTGVPAAPPSRPLLVAAPNPTFGEPVRFVRDAVAAPAELTIHDALGRRIRTLREGGESASWDGSTDAGGRVPAGVYFVRWGATGAVRVTVIR